MDTDKVHCGTVNASAISGGLCVNPITLASYLVSCRLRMTQEEALQLHRSQLLVHVLQVCIVGSGGSLQR